MERPAQRPAGAEEMRAVERVSELDPEGGSIAIHFLDHLPEVPDAEDDLAESLSGELLELVGEKGAPGDGDEGFRDCFGDRAQPGRKAPGEDCDRHVFGAGDHGLRSLVPSKSKRKRTSLSPWERIAWRSLALSLA